MSLHSLSPERGTLSLQTVLRGGTETLDAARRIYGVVPAKVIEVHDKKNKRHKKGNMVKLWFPWLQQHDEEEKAKGKYSLKKFEPWARCIAPDAGNKLPSGFKMSPNKVPLAEGSNPYEVGDEVLVAFEHGDPTVPYVLGAVWNKQQNIPKPTTPATDSDSQAKANSGGAPLKTRSFLKDSIAGGNGANKIMFIKSRSGHLIVMDDNEGTVRLEDRTGNSCIQLEKDQILMIQRKGDIYVWAKKTISFACETYQIHASGLIEYEADKNVSINAKGNATNYVGGKLYRCPTHKKNISPTKAKCNWPKKSGKKWKPCNTQMVLWKNGGVTKCTAMKNFTIASKKTVAIRSEKNMSWDALKGISICSTTDDVKIEAKQALTMMGLMGIQIGTKAKANFEGKSTVSIMSPMKVQFLANSDLIIKGAVILLN